MRMGRLSRSSVRMVSRMSWLQNLEYPGHLIHWTAQRFFKSEVKTADFPRPWRHLARMGSPLSAVRRTLACGLALVETYPSKYGACPQAIPSRIWARPVTVGRKGSSFMEDLEAVLVSCTKIWGTW